uniref:Uncharacterized protein n=1 Tax=Meloidogyne enterolobii TaxID=390850 RepID=A0A6V7XKN8_MELEN|nr:unnamed protein product [Meloidogyne enterolobii]
MLKRSLVVVLRLLIENIPLLSARQTRDLIKSDQMIEICSQFWNLGANTCQKTSKRRVSMQKVETQKVDLRYSGG